MRIMARFGEALQRSVSRFGAVRVCTGRKAGLRIMAHSGEALQLSVSRFGAVRVCRRKSKERERERGRNSYNRKIGVEEEGFDLRECSLGI
jgi:hypothetical protein